MKAECIKKTGSYAGHRIIEPPEVVNIVAVERFAGGATCYEFAEYPTTNQGERALYLSKNFRLIDPESDENISKIVSKKDLQEA